MLGIILLVIIARQFYILAENYNENKWVYALVSIVVYYGSTFVIGFIIGMIMAITGDGVEESDSMVIGLVTIPFGLLAVYIFYVQLKKKWSTKREEEIGAIDEIGQNNEE